MRPILRASLPLIIAALPLLTSAAGLAAAKPAVSPAMVKVAHNARLGTFLVDAKGMTLYYFLLDKHGKLACVGKCLAFWPPLILPRSAAVPATVKGVSGTFGIVIRSGGARQLTYNGKPLYVFAGDQKPGQTNGQGFHKVWWVAAVSAPSAGASSSGGGKGGW